MTMGCGDLRCNSSKLFMRENMLMHKGMAIKFSCNPDVDFVRGMIPHHAGALKMCAVLRQTTPSATLEPFLAYLCNHIEQGQSREITQMTSWLANRSMSATTVCSGNDSLTHAGMAMGCGNGTCLSTQLFIRENMLMHKGMAIKFSCNPDVDFVRGMIPHHAGALKMCAVLRQTTPSATLEPFLAYLCNHIEREQSREITQMTSWLANRSVSFATASCPPSPCQPAPATAAPAPQTPAPASSDAQTVARTGFFVLLVSVAAL
jgi:uncharacterized protein (DUF305 family)